MSWLAQGETTTTILTIIGSVVTLAGALVGALVWVVKKVLGALIKSFDKIGELQQSMEKLDLALDENKAAMLVNSGETRALINKFDAQNGRLDTLIQVLSRK